jgi:hypothetical protein
MILEVRMRSANLTSSSCGGLGGLRPPELISAPLAFSAVQKEKRKKSGRTTFLAEDDISGGNVVFRRPQGAVVGGGCGPGACGSQII